MIWDKEEAKEELERRILGCFDSYNLNVSAGVSATGTISSLRDLCQRTRLTAQEIQAAIEPRITNFLASGYMDFGGNEPRAWNEDPAKVRSQARTMASDIAWELTRPARKRR